MRNIYLLIFLFTITGCSQKYQVDSSDRDIWNFDTENLSQEKKLEFFAIKKILFDRILRSCSRPEINFMRDIDLCVSRLAMREQVELIQQNRIKSNDVSKNIFSRSDISITNEALLILLLGDIGAGNLEGLPSQVDESEIKRRDQMIYMQSRQKKLIYLRQLRALENQNAKPRKEE